jgi:predicted alpha/beta hydrolase family esterase
MKNVVIIHGAKGPMPFLKSLINECEMVGIPISLPSFPTMTSEFAEIDFNFKNWENKFLALVKQGVINENTTIVAHSLGTIVTPKVLAKHNIKIDLYASVAGFSGKLRSKDCQRQLEELGFSLGEQEIKRAAPLVKKAVAFFSDNDYLIEREEQEAYAENMGAEKRLLPDHDHFSRRSNVTKVDSLEELVIENHFKSRNQ